jgi:hypothetical protein
MANEADIKLFDAQVKVEATDLCVDSPSRRSNNSPYRRALVHDAEDGLTLNWGNDYPGGVKIIGNLTVSGKITNQGLDLTGEVLKLENEIDQLKTVLATITNQVNQLRTALASVDDNWRWCNKCEGLFYGGHETKGVCPAPAKAGSREHSLEGSPNYRLLK